MGIHRATSARVTSRDVRERDTRSSTLIAALPAIDRARQRFFNWQEKIRIVAVARLCYPGVRDEPFPLVKKSSKLGLVGTRVRRFRDRSPGGVLDLFPVQRDRGPAQRTRVVLATTSIMMDKDQVRIFWTANLVGRCCIGVGPFGA